MKNKNVGESSKTPFKHWILNAVLGQQVGVLSLNKPGVPCRAEPHLLIIDMCAGDAKDSEFSGQSSASIITGHMDFRGLKSRAVFIERQPVTFGELEKNVEMKEGVELLNMDARNFVAPVVGKNQAVFVNCDPNSVDQIPLTEDFMNSLNRYTTMVITLGCNVAGIKRLERERREEWFNYTNLMIKNLPGSHELILCWVKKDSAQWAYLVRLPKVWSRDAKKRYLKAGEDLLHNGIGVVLYGSETEAFNKKLNELFLTKKELENDNAKA